MGPISSLILMILAHDILPLNDLFPASVMSICFEYFHLCWPLVHLLHIYYTFSSNMLIFSGFSV